MPAQLFIRLDGPWARIIAICESERHGLRGAHLDGPHARSGWAWVVDSFVSFRFVSFSFLFVLCTLSCGLLKRKKRSQVRRQPGPPQAALAGAH